MFEELRALGYEGGYDAVRRYARSWSRTHAGQTAAAFVPLSFAPGEAYQFDWSHEIVVLSGVTVTVKVAHVRLCHSRMMFVRAYPRETQEMVFDAHERAFAFFKGACTRGIYDNMKTAVEAIFVGKERQYNRRFLQMCSHHLVDPVACTPASGWEKGQVENQVGLVRERFFTPTPAGQDLRRAERLAASTSASPTPRRIRIRNVREQTVWEVFEEERPSLVPYRGRFDGFHALPASVSKTCLVRFDNNKYSVNASAVGRPVEIHAYADRIVIRQDGRVVGGTPPPLSGAARRSTIPGITCRSWPASPARCATARRSRTGCCRPRWSGFGASSPDPMTAIVRWSPSSPPCSRDGLPAVEAACAQAMSEGVHSSDVIINILARQRDPDRRRPSSRRMRCGFATRRPPIAPDTISSGAHDHGANRSPRPDGRTQALRDEERLSTRSSPPRSNASMNRNASPAICSRPRSREKQARSIKYQLTIAKLPLAKDVDEFEFSGHADQRDPGARSRRRQLHGATAQCRSGRRDRSRDIMLTWLCYWSANAF